jgi:prepilin peptidase CpaA
VFTIQSTASIVFCGFLLGIGIYLDLKRHRIPNLLTLPACLAGVLYHILSSGFASGLLFSMKGLALGLAILIIPFLIGGMGGGDVKLLAALGSWLGPAGVFNLFLYGALAGGVIALIMVAKKSGLEGIKSIFLGIFFDLAARQRPQIDQRNPGLPYSIPIAAGYVAYLLIGRVL